MRVVTYLSFKGDCEAAFKLYEECLGAKVEGIFRYRGSPMLVPPDWQDKVMHGSITIYDQLFQAADVLPENYERPMGFNLSIQLSDPARAEQIFNCLAKGGTEKMPLEKTFWAERFGEVVDRFGIAWTINCEAAHV